MASKRNNHYTNGLIRGYRSGLESSLAEQIESIGLPPNYETHKMPYTKPETKHVYTVDFALRKKDGDIMFIETKGRFTLEDRKKMVLIKEQYPHYDIRFIFTNSRGKINKGSKTTYAMWCDKKGFQYADKTIPDEWIAELDT